MIPESEKDDWRFVVVSSARRELKEAIMLSGSWLKTVSYALVMETGTVE